MLFAYFAIWMKIQPLLNAIQEMAMCMADTVKTLSEQLKSSDDTEVAECAEKVEENLEKCSDENQPKDSEGNAVLSQECKDINDECGCVILEEIVDEHSPLDEEFSPCCDEFKELEGDSFVESLGESFNFTVEDIVKACVDTVENFTAELEEDAQECKDGKNPFEGSNTFLIPANGAQDLSAKFLVGQKNLLGPGSSGAVTIVGACVGVALVAAALFAIRRSRPRPARGSALLVEEPSEVVAGATPLD